MYDKRREKPHPIPTSKNRHNYPRAFGAKPKFRATTRRPRGGHTGVFVVVTTRARAHFSLHTTNAMNTAAARAKKSSLTKLKNAVRKYKGKKSTGERISSTDGDDKNKALRSPSSLDIFLATGSLTKVTPTTDKTTSSSTLDSNTTVHEDDVRVPTAVTNIEENTDSTDTDQEVPSFWDLQTDPILISEEYAVRWGDLIREMTDAEHTVADVVKEELPLISRGFARMFPPEYLCNEMLRGEVDRVLEDDDIGHPLLLGMRVYIPCLNIQNHEMLHVNPNYMLVIHSPKPDSYLKCRFVRDARRMARVSFLCEPGNIGIAVPGDQVVMPRDMDVSYYYYIYRYRGRYFPLPPEIYIHVLYNAIRIVYPQRLRRIAVKQRIRPPIRGSCPDRFIPIFPADPYLFWKHVRSLTHRLQSEVLVKCQAVQDIASQLSIETRKRIGLELRDEDGNVIHYTHADDGTPRELMPDYNFYTVNAKTGKKRKKLNKMVGVDEARRVFEPKAKRYDKDGLLLLDERSLIEKHAPEVATQISNMSLVSDEQLEEMGCNTTRRYINYAEPFTTEGFFRRIFGELYRDDLIDVLNGIPKTVKVAKSWKTAKEADEAAMAAANIQNGVEDPATLEEEEEEEDALDEDFITEATLRIEKLFDTTDPSKPDHRPKANENVHSLSTNTSGAAVLDDVYPNPMVIVDDKNRGEIRNVVVPSEESAARLAARAVAGVIPRLRDGGKMEDIEMEHQMRSFSRWRKHSTHHTPGYSDDEDEAFATHIFVGNHEEDSFGDHRRGHTRASSGTRRSIRNMDDHEDDLLCKTLRASLNNLEAAYHNPEDDMHFDDSEQIAHERLFEGDSEFDDSSRSPNYSPRRRHKHDITATSPVGDLDEDIAYRKLMESLNATASKKAPNTPLSSIIGNQKVRTDTDFGAKSKTIPRSASKTSEVLVLDDCSVTLVPQPIPEECYDHQKTKKKTTYKPNSLDRLFYGRPVKKLKHSALLQAQERLDCKTKKDADNSSTIATMSSEATTTTTTTASTEPILVFSKENETHIFYRKHCINPDGTPDPNGKLMKQAKDKMTEANIASIKARTTLDVAPVPKLTGAKRTRKTDDDGDDNPPKKAKGSVDDDIASGTKPTRIPSKTNRRRPAPRPKKKSGDGSNNGQNYNLEDLRCQHMMDMTEGERAYYTKHETLEECPLLTNVPQLYDAKWATILSEMKERSKSIDVENTTAQKALFAKILKEYKCVAVNKNSYRTLALQVLPAITEYWGNPIWTEEMAKDLENSSDECKALLNKMVALMSFSAHFDSI